MKNITLIYRENDLYNTLVPLVVNFLSGVLGYDVDVIEFDRTTDKSEIVETLSDKIDELQGQLIMTDLTCKPGVDDGRLAWQQACSDLNMTTSLDGIFGPVVVEFIADVESGGSGYRTQIDMKDEVWEDDEAYYAQYREIFLRVFESMPQAKYPETVFVARSRICDHDPFGRLRFHDEGDKAPGILKGWLIEAGHSDVRVLDAENAYRLSRQAKEVDDSNVWIISDRHNDSHGFDADELEATVLELPLSNLLQTAMEQNLLSLEKHKVEEVIKSKLREEFGNEG